MRRSGKKALSILLTIVLGLGVVAPSGIFGNNKVFAANEFLGSGTASNPYLIGTADQLNQIRGAYLNAGLYFKQTKNIDLSTSDYKDNWTPIGNNRATPFRGNFNGNGFAINGLKINTSGNNLGLFGLTSEESIISKVNLENVDVTGNNSVGSLVGANRGKVSYSYATGNVGGKDRVGGLIGDNGVAISNGHAIIDNSYAHASVTGSGFSSGGLVGTNSGAINYSYATGNVTGDYAVGGLVGNNDGTISYSYATGEMIDGQSIGGLVGSNSTNTEIRNSFATGKVNGSFSSGGLTGYNYGTISKSYSTGEVNGGQHVGGLVSNLEVSGIISDSFTTGKVSGYSFVGGLIGYAYSNSSGSYSNSYASGHVSGDIAPISPLTSNGEGNNIGSIYLDENMKGPVGGWDFNTLWAIDPSRNGGYPYLQDFLFQLKYDGNGNTGGTVPIDSNLYLPGETASIYTGTLNLVKTGYTFIGWNTQENGNGKSYSGSFEAMPYTTLYAQWEAQSSAATLTSGIGIVSTDGTTNETITNIPSGTTLAVLKEEIMPATNATFEIYDEDGATVATNLTSGKKVIVTAADGVTKVTYIVSVIASSAKDIMSFSLAEQTGAATINKTAHTVEIQVGNATDVTNLKATFTLSPEASAKVGMVDQVSGLSANNFTTPVTYTVKAGDGSSQNWTVTVRKSSEKDIMAFSLNAVTQTKAATINTTDFTVEIEVVYATSYSSLSNLKATFSLSPDASAKVGSITQVSGTTANDFRNPVQYVVTAADGSTQEWTVYVSIELSSAKDITAYSFSSQTKPATINTAARTVDIEVKYGTNVTNLIATFTLTPASSTKVNGTTQRSGTTSNNFTNPVTYVVQAENGTRQNWVVTVTVAPPSSANDIVAFSFAAQNNPAAINTTAQTVAIEVKHGTNLNGLKATFTLSAGASAKVGSIAQVSGTTGNDFTSPVIYTVTAQDGTTKQYIVTVTVAPSSAKDITAFSFADLTPVVTGTISGTTIALTVPYGTDRNGLKATFTLSAGASAQVGSIAQVSGTTGNDFTSPVTYTVTAQDGTTKQYIVTVTVAPSSAKDITAFNFADLTPVVTGTISGTTIALTVPYGTDRNGMKAAFTLSAGASAQVGSIAQVSGTTGNDFTSPVIYTVTALDGTTKQYTVTVTVAPSSAKDITAFSFADLTPVVTGTISGTNIALIVPYGTDRNGLKATFTLSAGASAKVGSIAQVSGTTGNDFTSPVTYTVTAQDGTTKQYIVTVTVAASNEKDITAFSFAELTPVVTGTISGTNIALTVPYGTDRNGLKVTFTLSAGASAQVGSIAQVSGTTGNDFTSPVIYTVTAQDGTTKQYIVTVTVAASNEKDITAFSFAELTPVVTGTISGTNIALTVPHGTDRNGMKATFTLSAGASAQVGSIAQVSGTTRNDFTGPVTYSITAVDGTQQNWVITVTNSASLSHDATISSTLGTVSVGGTANESISNIPYGTTIAVLKAAIIQAAGATFEIFDADGTTIASNLTSSSKVIVVAQDGITKVTYTVSVNAAPPSGGGSTPPSDPKAYSTDGKLTVPAGKSGEVSLGKEIILSIPANATDKELRITIDKLTDTQNLLKNNEVMITGVYEILKNFKENFNNPVSLSIAFNPALLKEGQSMAIFYYDELKKGWVEVAGGIITGNYITVKINHFTKFAVIATGQSPVDGQEPTKHLSDITGHWAETAIKQAVGSGMVNGYPDGTFKPNHTVTRAEFTVMLMNTLKLQGLDAGTSPAFTDEAKIGAWAKNAVAQAVQAGYLKGYADGSFRPDAAITRAEMAMIVANALGLSLQASSETGFADDKAIPDWAKNAVSAVKMLGIVGGKGNNTFDPNAGTTRAEAVTVLLKILDQKNK
ncbi:S-layer homology domain-containing protein [Paenibacillus paridis]|uniref:S-layer homology domain-containing protein n=1 Tax=Paenibacillus paridis TaxID=2583376 RepID=UPI001120907B|nr:S-layer homology domain-containing protein [Paenibacillus paridis]